MSSHKPFSFLVISSALCAASCVTVMAAPGQAAAPVAAGTMSTEMAQAVDVGAASPAAAQGSEPVAAPPEVTTGPADGTASPAAAAAVPHTQAGAGCPHGGGCDKCKGAASHDSNMMMRTVSAMHGAYGDPEKAGPTDHQRVVGRWGIEARSAGLFSSSPANPDPRCAARLTGGGCSDIQLMSIGIRRWHTENYAYSAGLSFGAGGGNTKGQGSWDTYVGVGPNFGAYFLLRQWKHLAINASPQLGLLYFAPSGSGNKSIAMNLAGKIEAEMQLGFMGLPGLSVGTDVGLGMNYTNVSNDAANKGGYSYWNIGTTGTSSVWGLFSQAFVRFYL